MLNAGTMWKMKVFFFFLSNPSTQMCPWARTVINLTNSETKKQPTVLFFSPVRTISENNGLGETHSSTSLLLAKLVSYLSWHLVVHLLRRFIQYVALNSIAVVNPSGDQVKVPREVLVELVLFVNLNENQTCRTWNESQDMAFTD